MDFLRPYQEQCVASYVLCEAERFDRRTPPAPTWYQVLINRMIQKEISEKFIAA
jgi:hypothetical protein